MMLLLRILLTSPPDLPDPDVTLSIPPLTMAGDSLTITCTATFIEPEGLNLMVFPTVLEWIAPDGTTITTGNPWVVGEAAVPGQVFTTSNLVFAPLHTSHAGEYGCRASIYSESPPDSPSFAPPAPRLQSEAAVYVSILSKSTYLILRGTV